MMVNFKGSIDQFTVGFVHGDKYSVGLAFM